MTITITPENRDLYGGDIEITSTVPATHPKLNIPLTGTRAAIRGASMQYRTFFRGDIIYKHDPTLNFNFTSWPDDGSENSRRMYLLYTVEKGFTPCEAKDWDLRPELQKVYEVVNGQIVLRTRRNIAGIAEYEIVMYRSEAEWRKSKAAMQMIDGIVPQADEMAGKSIEGAGVSLLPTTVSTTTEKINIGDVQQKGRT